jgi:hypothetical protein
MDDCYSSNDKQRHLTPFRRHDWGLKQSSRWVPKVKARSVSFADPIVTAVWPQVEKCGQAEDVGGMSGSMGAVILEPVHSPATTTCKVNNSVDLTTVFTSIHKSLDSVLTHNSLNLGTELPASTPAVSPNEFAVHNCLDSVLVDCSGVLLGAAQPPSSRPGLFAGLLEPHRVGEDKAPGVDQVGRLDASAIHDSADNISRDLGDAETRRAKKSHLPPPLKTLSLKTQKCSSQLPDTQRMAAIFNSTPVIPCSNASLQLVEAARVTAAPFIPNQMLILESQDPQPSDFSSSSVMPHSLLNSELDPVAPSCGIPDTSNKSLEDFILSISEDPESPLI